VSALWFVAQVIFWCGLALIVLAPLIAAMLLSLGIWLLGRLAEQMLWIESKLGGGPTQLAYMPTLDHSARRTQVADINALDVRGQRRTRSNEPVGKNLLPVSNAPAPKALLLRAPKTSVFNR
jgi:hypothetical protein